MKILMLTTFLTICYTVKVNTDNGIEEVLHPSFISYEGHVQFQITKFFSIIIIIIIIMKINLFSNF